MYLDMHVPCYTCTYISLQWMKGNVYTCVAIYISTNSIWGFIYFHILGYTWYYHTLFLLFWWMKWLFIMILIFIIMCWLMIGYFISQSACLNLLPSFQLGCFCYLYWYNECFGILNIRLLLITWIENISAMLFNACFL